MRGWAMFLGILFLFPGACSLIFMVGFGSLDSLRLMLEPFRFGGIDREVALIWGGASWSVSSGY
jgi:hypothetical protein